MLNMIQVGWEAPYYCFAMESNARQANVGELAGMACRF